MNSPLFPVLDNTASYSFKTAVTESTEHMPSDLAAFYNGTGKVPEKRVKMEVITVGRGSGEDMSVKEAEDLLLRTALPRPSENTIRKFVDVNDKWGLVSSWLDESDSLGIVINRQANIIAARTKIAAANIVLMHPNNIAILKLGFSKSASPSTVGRWTNVGVLNNSMQVWTNPDFPHDEVVVMLHNENTAPGVMIGDHFVPHPEMEELMARIHLEFNVVHYGPEQLAHPAVSECLGEKDVSILDAAYAPLEMYGSDNEIIRLSSNLNRIKTAARDLINDVKRRHPDESLTCPLMQALEKALDE